MEAQGERLNILPGIHDIHVISHSNSVNTDMNIGQGEKKARKSRPVGRLLGSRIDNNGLALMRLEELQKLGNEFYIQYAASEEKPYDDGSTVEMIRVRVEPEISSWWPVDGKDVNTRREYTE